MQLTQHDGKIVVSITAERRTISNQKLTLSLLSYRVVKTFNNYTHTKRLPPSTDVKTCSYLAHVMKQMKCGVVSRAQLHTK